MLGRALHFLLVQDQDNLIHLVDGLIDDCVLEVLVRLEEWSWDRGLLCILFVALNGTIEDVLCESAASTVSMAPFVPKPPAFLGSMVQSAMFAHRPSWLGAISTHSRSCLAGTHRLDMWNSYHTRCIWVKLDTFTNANLADLLGRGIWPISSLCPTGTHKRSLLGVCHHLLALYNLLESRHVGLPLDHHLVVTDLRSYELCIILVDANSPNAGLVLSLRTLRGVVPLEHVGVLIHVDIILILETDPLGLQSREHLASLMHSIFVFAKVVTSFHLPLVLQLVHHVLYLLLKHHVSHLDTLNTIKRSVWLLRVMLQVPLR